MSEAWFTRLWNKIVLAHGSGGKETSEVIEGLLLKLVPRNLWRVEGGAGLDVLDDSSLIPVGDGFIAVTIDSYTVNPIFFPGGDIGLLAASGTINDLLMTGATPIAMLDAIVVEEGFPTEKLERILKSMIETCKSEGVALIGGDFKVMPKGEVEGIVITTAGIGFTRKPILDTGLRPGDKIIVTGTIGDHGAAILAAQQGLSAQISVESDVKPLGELMKPLLKEYSDAIHAAGDPTRGGLAMLVNDWARKNNLVILVREEDIPVKTQVRAYAEMLGVDPLSLANEGVAVLGVDSEKAEEVLEFIRSLGFTDASIIGEVYEAKEKRHAGRVLFKSRVGGVRILEPPSGSPMPRIC